MRIPQIIFMVILCLWGYRQGGGPQAENRKVMAIFVCETQTKARLFGGLRHDGANINANKGAFFQLRVAKYGNIPTLEFIENLDNGRKMDLLWPTIDKECKYWTDPNAKAAFVTDLERELPADILSTRDFEWIAPKEYWTEIQF